MPVQFISWIDIGLKCLDKNDCFLKSSSLQENKVMYKIIGINSFVHTYIYIYVSWW